MPVVERWHAFDGNRLRDGHIAGNGKRFAVPVIDALDRRHEVGVGARQAMLGAVKPPDLLLFRDAQADAALDDAERGIHQHRRPDEDRHDAEQLHAEQARVAGVEKPLETSGRCGVGEEPDREGAPDAVRKMDADRSDRIVHMEAQVERLYHHDHEKTRDGTDDRRTQRIDGIAARRDADQARKGAVQAHGDVGLSGSGPRESHGRARRNRGGDGRGHEYRGKRDTIPCGGAVESIPAEPQDKASERAERDGMARDRVHLGHVTIDVAHVLPQTRSDHDCADEGRDASDRMDCGRAGEVMEAHLDEPALRVPHPTCLDGIHEEGDDG